jgi:hypothetical protein
MSCLTFNSVERRYFRLVRRYLEHGEKAPYEKRLDA